MFEVPVTVVQPIELDAKSNYRLEFDPVLTKPNTILRNFILVPNHATWAGEFDPIIGQGKRFLNAMSILLISAKTAI